ncbi:MAG: DUF1593 domain-containing protein [Pirellulales bacterium]
MKSPLTIAALFAVACAGFVAARSLKAEPDRLRLIIETDAGGDPDDEQSLVRFLLYSSEFDVQGIIANRAHARDGENENTERTGLGIVRRQLEAYEQCYANLVQNDPRYPTPAALRRVTVAGYDDVEDGVQRIIAAVDADDPRPLWYGDWGTDHGAAKNCLWRALDQVLRERGPEGYARFKGRLRLASNDFFGPHTYEIAPPFPLWVDTFEPELAGRRWYHQFSRLTATAGGFDLERDVRTGHGPLGALYPTNTTHKQKEGDTMSFLYLVPTGMNDPERPAWGSWAGRYGHRGDQAERNYYWADVADAWHSSSSRENTLERWAADLQNDFRARLDWCVLPPTEANHPPRVVVNGETALAPQTIAVPPGEQIALDAGTTTDPDGDALEFTWFEYPEAGSYRGRERLAETRGARLPFLVPADLGSAELHLMLRVADEGEPPLTRYRRVVIKSSAAPEARAAKGP